MTQSTSTPSPSIVPSDLFERIADALAGEPSHRARLLHETLVLLCATALRDTGAAYGNLFSQLSALCRRLHVEPSLARDMQAMRRDSNRREPVADETFLADCRALATLVAMAFGTDVPEYLDGRLPRRAVRREGWHGVDYKYIRCIVRAVGTDGVVADADQDDCQGEIAVWLADPAHDHSYLLRSLGVGTQLNLLDCSTAADGRLVPSVVVFEPDFLVDISALARCFEDYGHHPLLYTLARMTPRANSQAILLGHFAGAALDDIINNPRASFHSTLRTTFRDHALEYATCPAFDAVEFKRAAGTQVDNIRRAVDNLFATADRTKAILEPSFVCERLGIQGRVDLMTTDRRLLVEQKSGSNFYLERRHTNRHGSLYVEKHYVQVLLYYGVLRYNFSLSEGSVDVRLLYSKYDADQGLLSVEMYRRLFVEAMAFRNRVVAAEYFMAREGFDKVVDHISASTLNTARLDSYFYNAFLRPQIDRVAEPLHRLSPLERAYLCRMTTFVLREQLLSKVGVEEGKGGSVADLWNMPLAEKLETGNIYMGLTLGDKTRSNPDGGYDTVSLDVPRQADDFLPNFRLGDMVYVYAYDGDGCPDVRRAILFKGVLAQLTSRRVTIHLNDAQNNPHLFRPGLMYAVEHASSDIGSSSAMSSLHDFVTASADRRDLLLSRREPRRDTSLTLSRGYDPTLDDLLLRVRQARDMFLLVGPPGTGKTSRAIRFVVEEELAHEGTSVLLMSYTNRAVDEICSMLDDASVDFLRVGNEYSCAPEYRSRLVSAVASADPRLDAISSRLRGARVVVGTTSSLMSRPFVFALKSFSLAVVDEAGQITEPNIIGLLAAHSDSRQLISRFVLVGDYKQLPAVVQQTEEEAAVADPLLRSIGLLSCRDSLFERLIRHERDAGRTDFIGVLRRQGRMHPDVAAFPDSRFYFAERLVPVPLPHQAAASLGYDAPSEDAFDDVLKTRRMLFVPSKPCHAPSLSDKVNTEEARIVADILRRVRRFYGARFSPTKTVGVIVPYRNQIAMIRKEIERLHVPELNDVTIDTVERYQGSQRDVIVYSFTIHRHWQLDFLAANRFVEDGHVIDRKLNVAMTRAKCQMVMTGNPALLAQDEVFRDMMENCYVAAP